MSRHDEQSEIAREERGIYAIIVAASLPVVLAFVVERLQVDSGATLSLVLMLVGLTGLLAGIAPLRRAIKARIPRAHIRR
jgi:hypothetical protein